ncbi:MAG TPA: 5-oxoprolinase subunit PxpA [Gaiellaceae bacterium]
MRIDLNADVGEGFTDDAGLLAAVTSASVACGFHAGSASTMRDTCSLAAASGVVIGAHPSYRDRDGFGRRELGLEPHVVRADVADQVAALAAAADRVGASVAYLKPHGALYHRGSGDDDVAAAVVDVAEAFGLAVLGWPGSALLLRAEAVGVRAVPEGFADRRYAPDGRLAPRTEPGALLDAEDAAAQALRLASRGEVGSLCVHGDTPGAAALAACVRAALTDAGVEVGAFA